jgi:hypothetical protein
LAAWFAPKGGDMGISQFRPKGVITMTIFEAFMLVFSAMTFVVVLIGLIVKIIDHFLEKK